MIALIPFEINNIEQLVSWIDNEEQLMQFAGPAYQYPLTKDQLEKSLLEEGRFVFTVVDTINYEIIGHAQILKKEDTFSLGRIIIGNKERRGKGIGALLIQELLNYGFDNLDRDWAELNVFDWNIPAIKCYEKVGFKVNPEVVFTREMKGKVWTAINMRISKVTYKS